MDDCRICHSINLRTQGYNKHPISWSLYGLATAVLPYLDPLLPRRLGQIKRMASERRRTPFRGDVQICEDCGYGLLSSPPTLDELQAYYTKGYWEQRPAARLPGSVAAHSLDPRAKTQIEFVYDHIANEQIRSVLEIGAGSALASLFLRDKLQPDVPTIGVCEPGAQWTDYYSAKGIERVAEFFPFSTTHGYDYVHTSHWLEHVRNLDETIDALRDVLDDHGFLFVEVPNTAHDYWGLPGYDSPHIHFFTTESLGRAFSDRGFQCLGLGEFGITREEQLNGIECTPDAHGPRDNGLWIRALFHKNS